MKFQETSIAGLYIIDSEKFGDERGHFRRLYCKNEQDEQTEIPWQPVQINHSFTAKAGTVRGMHYQAHPALEAKMVRCLKGKILDVAVDLREGSPTFLQHETVELSGENGRAFLIPAGCAHGFQSLEDNCDMIYLHSAPYAKEHEGGLLYDDTRLGIDWPLPVSIISKRDQAFQPLTDDFTGLKNAL